jgi:hypothetical protein
MHQVLDYQPGLALQCKEEARGTFKNFSFFGTGFVPPGRREYGSCECESLDSSMLDGRTTPN